MMDDVEILMLLGAQKILRICCTPRAWDDSHAKCATGTMGGDNPESLALLFVV